MSEQKAPTAEQAIAHAAAILGGTVESETVISDISLDFKPKSEGGGEFLPVEANLYKLRVQEIRVEQAPNRFKNNEMTTFLRIRFEVMSTIDGSPIKDVGGAVHEPASRIVFATLDVKSMGHRKGGEPSKTRACLAALLGVDPDGTFSIPSVQSLVGKELRALISVSLREDGVTKKNKIDKFIKI